MHPMIYSAGLFETWIQRFLAILFSITSALSIGSREVNLNKIEVKMVSNVVTTETEEFVISFKNKTKEAFDTEMFGGFSKLEDGNWVDLKGKEQYFGGVGRNFDGVFPGGTYKYRVTIAALTTTNTLEPGRYRLIMQFTPINGFFHSEAPRYFKSVEFTVVPA